MYIYNMYIYIYIICICIYMYACVRALKCVRTSACARCVRVAYPSARGFCFALQRALSGFLRGYACLDLLCHLVACTCIYASTPCRICPSALFRPIFVCLVCRLICLSFVCLSDMPVFCLCVVCLLSDLSFVCLSGLCAVCCVFVWVGLFCLTVCRCFGQIHL